MTVPGIHALNAEEIRSASVCASIGGDGSIVTSLTRDTEGSDRNVFWLTPGKGERARPLTQFSIQPGQGVILLTPDGFLIRATDIRVVDRM